MKKTILALMATLAIITVFASCKKDNDNYNDTLNGTVWVSEQIFSNGERGIETISFKKDDVEIESFSLESDTSVKVYGKYQYYYPRIVITILVKGVDTSIRMFMKNGYLEFTTNGKTLRYYKR